MKKIVNIAFALLLLAVCCTREKIIIPESEQDVYVDKIVLTVLNTTKESIQLSWTQIEKHQFVGYKIMRYQEHLNTGEPIKYIYDNTVVTYTDSVFPYSPGISYQAVAYLSNGDSLLSNIERTTQLINLNLGDLVVTNDSVQLSWTKIDNRSFVQYSILRGEQTLAVIKDPDSTSYTDSSYPYGNNIEYKIRAVFSSGAIVESNTQSFRSGEPAITLFPLTISQDSVILSWTRIRERFVNYKVFRVNKITGVVTEIATIEKPWITNFTDKEVPYLPEIAYYVVGALSGGQYYWARSNHQTYSRSGIVLIPLASDNIKFDDTNKLLFFINSNGSISSYDIELNSIRATINTGAGIPSASLGVYDGVKELYVPVSQKVVIYNSRTLEKTDEINFGTVINDVVAQSGKIFVTRPLQVFDRQTKQLVAQTNNYNSISLNIFPQSNFRILATRRFSPDYMGYFDFKNDGTFQSKKESFSAISDPGLTEMFPDGTRFITTNMGIIYNSELERLAILPAKIAAYSCFAFNQSGSEIYAAGANMIYVFSSVTLLPLRSYRTNIFPVKIFRYNNELIIVGRGEKFSSDSYIIERINL